MSTGPSSPGVLTILPHYKQEDVERFCGPASAKMVLEGCFGIGRTQRELWDAIQTGCNNGTWYSAPPCLCRTANDAVATSAPFAVTEQPCAVLNACDSPGLLATCDVPRADVMGAALNSVYGGGAGLVAVNCNRHWVTLCGYETTGGATIAETSKLYFHDPAPAANSGAIDITKDSWLTNYFNGGRGSPSWFVAIAATGNGRTAPNVVEDSGDPDVNSQAEGLDQDQIAAFAVERASRSLLNRHHPLWIDAVRGPADADPFAVRRLDNGQTYSLVPIEDAKGNVRVLGQIDAADGRYLSTLFSARSAALPKRGEEIVSMLHGRIFRRRDGSKWTADKSRLTFDVTLVWRPCRQSLSPFLPFRLVRSQEDSLYVRVDGEIFTELTDSQFTGG